jgi:phage terminase small subunit
MRRRKLTDLQETFVDQYCIDKNATQACLRAGYKTKYPDRVGPELLGKTWVRAEIDKRLAKLAKKAGLTAERVMQEVADVATSNIMDGMEYDEQTREFSFKNPNDIPEKFWRAAQEVTTYQLPDGGGLAIKLKMHPKMTALKMEYDRHKLTAPEGGTTNNIASFHVNILDYNKAMRRIGQPEITE